jgi:hypothetical protein
MCTVLEYSIPLFYVYGTHFCVILPNEDMLGKKVEHGLHHPKIIKENAM